jgi:hypothetical protein
LGFVALVLAGVLWAKPAKLILDEKSGAPATCEVRDYDIEKQLVTVKLGSSYTNLPFSSFSPGTQKNIECWAADQCFLSSSGLRIRVTMADSTKKSDSDSKYNKTKKRNRLVEYVVAVENRSLFEMKDITTETRIFFEEGSKESSVREKTVKFRARKFDLEPGKEKRLSCRVTIRDEEYSFTSGETVTFSNNGMSVERQEKTSTSTIKDKLKGFHVRVSKSGWDQSVLERDSKKGRVPPEKSWDEYKQPSSPTSTSGTAYPLTEEQLKSIKKVQ